MPRQTASDPMVDPARRIAAAQSKVVGYLSFTWLIVQPFRALLPVRAPVVHGPQRESQHNTGVGQLSVVSDHVEVMVATGTERVK